MSFLLFSELFRNINFIHSGFLYVSFENFNEDLPLY